MDKPIIVVGGSNSVDALRSALGATFAVEALRSVDAAVRLRESRPLSMPALLIVTIDPIGDSPAGVSLHQLAQLRASAAAAQVPILALVPRDNPQALVAAFELGASDCAGLPLDDGEISARVTALLHRKKMTDRLSAEAQAVRLMAHTDAVTGLFNRHYFDSALEQSVQRARAQVMPLVVLMLDIDSFKPVNDRFGHAAGDRALKTVAQRLCASVRGSDSVARYGGDELVVLMPDTDLTIARRIAERLRHSVEATPVEAMPIKGRAGDVAALRITVSIGIAALETGDIDGAALLARADSALFVAKRAGRNRVETAGSAAA